LPKSISAADGPRINAIRVSRRTLLAASVLAVVARPSVAEAAEPVYASGYSGGYR
jgi:hypothetical protein